MYALSTEPLVGQTLATKYAIRRLIGRGGVGVVYLASELESGRDVVLKCLAEHWLHDPEAVARFEREARRLDSLRHPNIVSMLGFEKDAGRAFLVMEYVRGRPLSEYMATRGSLTFEEFVPIAAQILKGMGYAHSREMMIRDVKPSNIMLCERKGRTNFVKILDFGLAKFLRGEAQITEEHVIGTVGYLAPEALKGEQGDLRVDVYAVGVLFYYMLSGRLPFEGASDATIFYKTVNEAPADLRERLTPGHGVPDALIQLIHRCLEKNPDDRPHDANLVVEQLIDAVPASLFRLPRIGESFANASTGSLSGNTGLISLIGADPRLKETAPVTPEASTSQRRLKATKVMLLSAAAATLLVTGGVLAMAWRSSSTPPQAGGEGNEVVAEAQLGQPVGSPSSPAAAHERPSTTPSLDAPPLPSEIQPPPRAADTAAEGLVLFHSSPVAQLVIDGVPRGTTPFRSKLGVGHHTIELSARGYEPWTSTYEVTETENEPINVQLLELPPQGRSSKPHRPRSASASSPSPTAAHSEPSGGTEPSSSSSSGSAAAPAPAVASAPAPDATGDALMSTRKTAAASRDRVFLTREHDEPSSDLLIRNR